MPKQRQKPSWGMGVPLVMSMEEARNIASRQKDRDWLNPISMNELKKAVAEKSATVYLSGITYDIQYRESDVFLRRSDGQFAPCGCVSYHSLEHYRFE